MNSISPQGLIRPVLNQQGAEWRGHVVAIGEGVNGLEFGDLVYLREKGNPTSVYLQNPKRDLADWWGDDPKAYFGDPAGGDGLVDVDLAENLMIGDPEMLLYRVNSLAEVCRGDHPKIEPLFNRVLVANLQRLSQTTTGVQLIAEWYRGPRPVGRVVSVGFDVKDFVPGEYVMVHPNRGTLIHYGKHELTLIEDKDIPISFGDDMPGPLVGWTQENFQGVIA